MKGKLQMDAKIPNLEIFENALYMKSVSMPLRFKFLYSGKFVQYKQFILFSQEVQIEDIYILKKDKCVQLFISNMKFIYYRLVFFPSPSLSLCRFLPNQTLAVKPSDVHHRTPSKN